MVHYVFGNTLPYKGIFGCPMRDKLISRIRFIQMNLLPLVPKDHAKNIWFCLRRFWNLTPIWWFRTPLCFVRVFYQISWFVLILHKLYTAVWYCHEIIVKDLGRELLKCDDWWRNLDAAPLVIRECSNYFTAVYRHKPDQHLLDSPKTSMENRKLTISPQTISNSTISQPNILFPENYRFSIFEKKNRKTQK